MLRRILSLFGDAVGVTILFGLPVAACWILQGLGLWGTW